ncbi:MAG: hypothetical protein L0Y71_03445 [Gemmataceae bacterium]|nr:hypothetical protein [Gemmataceae bacterium]
MNFAIGSVASRKIFFAPREPGNMAASGIETNSCGCASIRMNANAVAYLRSYKEILKQRFQQIDIWITAHEIQIL